jgi:hypothetical protein
MYPYLASILPDGHTLVNSERHPYIEVVGGTAKNDMKPDFWCSLIPALITRKNPPARFPVEDCTYGCPLDNCSFTVDCILDGKICGKDEKGALNMADCGKLFRYLDALSINRNANPRGAFYNSSE